jgi:hypothetical protein
METPMPVVNALMEDWAKGLVERRTESAYPIIERSL